MSELKAWTSVVVPHKDIQEGRLDEAVFAADLSDVVAQRGPVEYRDARTFFRRTYPTRGLVRLLSTVLRRLAGKGGEGVIQIRTPFGGGKTHSLIALYHLVQQGSALGDLETVATVLQQAEVDAPEAARVVTFVGTAADPLKGKTPWGELADQLGHYERLAEHDSKRRAPGKDLLHKVIGESPTLILMDEIAEYAVKAKDFRDQLVAFFQELTETVKVLPRAALVVTLPSSTPYGEEGERALRELEQVFKRVENIETPVEDEEIHEVIRRRLFEHLGDPKAVQAVADAFTEMYRQLGNDVPRETAEPTYRERIRRAYPFHPELIDVLMGRWSTFPEFQRTRGVLRLLAQVVGELHHAQHNAPLILPAHINLANPTVREELLRHIGSDYQGVLNEDLKKAEQLDRETGTEYARFKVASGLARAIFFASFSAGERQGISIQRLRLAVLQPGLEAAFVGDALKRLEGALWYLHHENGLYLFRKEHNLNRVLLDKEEAITEEQLTEAMRAQLEQLCGKAMSVFLWVSTSQDVPDTRELKLVVFSPEQTRDKGEAFARELLEQHGQTYRTYRNTLLVLAPDAEKLNAAQRSLKRWLAHRAVEQDRTITLSEANRKRLEEGLEHTKMTANNDLLAAYRYLGRLGTNQQGVIVQWFDLGQPTSGADRTLSERVWTYLVEEELLLEHLAPRVIVEKAMGAEEREKGLSEIYESFLRYPELPMLARKAVLIEAVIRGVREGVFGVRVGERVWFREVVSEADLQGEAVIVRATAIQRTDGERLSSSPAAAVPAVAPSPAAMSVREPAATANIIATSGDEVTASTYVLRIQVEPSRISDVMRGVLIPLQRGGATLQLELIVRAEGTIQKHTLDTVHETLQQLGAVVLEDLAD